LRNSILPGPAGKRFDYLTIEDDQFLLSAHLQSPHLCELAWIAEVVVVDREGHWVVTSWEMGLTLGNYAMALDEADHRLFVVSRVPARLVVMDTATGKVVQKLAAVGDCDDVFWDASRKRIYATGGEGAISVFEQQDADHYKEATRVPTVKGARTS
jgi:hypothetical protein